MTMDFPKRLGLGEAQLALSSFVACRHPTESCGHNGLPLTPNSIAIFGRATYLKTLDHENLCIFLVSIFLYFLTKCESYVTVFMVSFYEGNENNENLVGP